MKIKDIILELERMNTNISRSAIESFVEKQLGLEDCSIEEREEIESKCSNHYKAIIEQAEIWFDSMRQSDEELEERQILMAEFHPSNLNK